MTVYSRDGKRLWGSSSSGPGIEAAAFAKDNQLIASTYGENGKSTLIFFDGETGKVLGQSKHEIGFRTLSVSPDGMRFISAGGEFSEKAGQTGAVRMWSNTGEVLKRLEGGIASVEGMAFSPDGQWLVTAGMDGLVRLWSLEGHLERVFSGHDQRVTAVAFSDDSKTIASGDEKGNVILWDLVGAQKRKIAAHKWWVSSLVFLANGSIVSGALDQSVKLHDSNGKVLGTYNHTPAHLVTQMVRTPDSKKLVLIGSELRAGSLAELDANTLQVLKTVMSEPMAALAMRADGTYVVSAEKGSFTLAPGVSLPGATGLAFSPDGQLILHANREKLALYKRTGELVKVLVGHTAHIMRVAFDPKGRVMASAAQDGSVRLWTQAGDQLVLLASGGEWIMHGADGLFDSSRFGSRLVAMVDGTEAFGVEQFALRNNRPDLLLTRMGLGSLELREHLTAQFRKRLRKAGLDEAKLAATVRIPQVHIDGLDKDGKNRTLRFTAQGVALKTYNVFVNDVPLFGAVGKPLTGASVTQSVPIELAGGSNKIEVSATDVAGSESMRALVMVSYDAPVERRLFFIGFGVSHYKNPALDLAFAHKDAGDLAAAFTALKGKGYADVRTKVLVDAAVTPEAIKEAKTFAAQTKTDDTLVVFIAGHGMHDTDKEATYYYLTHGADPNALSKTAAEFGLIEDLLQGVPARQKLFLMDTCESGEAEESEAVVIADANARGLKARAVRGIKKTGTAPPRRFLQNNDRLISVDLNRRSGAIVFSSSRGGEFSFESEALQNGYFTKAILIALGSKVADANKDGLTSTDELRAFVAADVAAKTQGMQHPTVDRDNFFVRFGF